MSDPDYRWQEEAVQAWQQNQCRGIVEAVTGTGKTFMAIMAIKVMYEHLRSAGKRLYPVVVVPTGVLQQQWLDRLQTAFAGEKLRIGLLGQGHSDRFDIHDILVAVVNSLVRHGTATLGFLTRNASGKSMLIADECHRYIGAQVHSQIIHLPFEYLLGLTARMPTGQQQLAYQGIPGFRRIVYEMDMPKAREAGLLPPFHLLNIPVALTTGEARDYGDLSDRIQKLREELDLVVNDDLRDGVGNLDMDAMKAYMKKARDGDPLRRKIDQFFIACYKRAAIYYKSANKLKALRLAIQRLASYGGHVLVFFERIHSANTAGEMLAMDSEASLPHDLEVPRAAFPWCKVVHSGMSMLDRQQAVREFAEPGNKILIACRTLDEGFDIPGVDVAIIAASTKSPLQRIQRIGRVLRRYNDEKRALILTFYAEGTGDAGVIENDKGMFPGPTDLYNCTKQNWLGTFAEALACYAKAPPTP